LTALYRARQFWFALKAAPSDEDLDRARQVLSPPLMDLFFSMQTGEQVHSLKVFHRLLKSKETSPELLAAALLHDVGKSQHPLRLWERVLVVAGQAIFPNLVNRWGTGEAYGWKRAFVVAAKHPVWGAEMAYTAGASPMVVFLIRLHRDEVSPAVDLENRLLISLQRADNES
jgi:hypothetical protein